jgi:hypothetical protein
MSRSFFLFFAGAGLAGIMYYSSLYSYIKRSDDEIKNELHSLRIMIDKYHVNNSV